jgi:hypothetical protein
VYNRTYARGWRGEYVSALRVADIGALTKTTNITI